MLKEAFLRFIQRPHEIPVNIVAIDFLAIGSLAKAVMTVTMPAGRLRTAKMATELKQIVQDFSSKLAIGWGTVTPSTALCHRSSHVVDNDRVLILQREKNQQLGTRTKRF